MALGNLGNAVGASIGLAAVFAVSAVAYTVVKLAGAAYLVHLGIQALRRPAARRPSRPWTPSNDGASSAMAACTDGVYVLLSAACGPALRAGRLAAHGRRFGACVYFGLGIYTLLAESHPARPTPK